MVEFMYMVLISQIGMIAGSYIQIEGLVLLIFVLRLWYGLDVIARLFDLL